MAIRTSTYGFRIFHLYFVDDLTLFSRANHDRCNTIINSLKEFSDKSEQTTKSHQVQNHFFYLLK